MRPREVERWEDEPVRAVGSADVANISGAVRSVQLSGLTVYVDAEHL